MSLQIWTEKYRPAKLADVVNQKHVVGRLEAWVKEKSIPNMIFAGPAGTGKCVTPETPILLPDNTVLSIEEAFKKDVKEVLTLGCNGKISKGKVKYFYKTKKDRLLKVKTKSGCYVVATPEHPFLILSLGSPKWVEAKDIKENSLLATPLRIPFFQTTKSVKIDWEKVPNIWARLECEVPIEKYKLQEGKQATVMEALDSDFRTCKEIAKMAGVSPETASWALRTFHKKHLIAKKKGCPARFALNNIFTRTKTVPLKEVKNESKIVKIFHKGKFHVPSYEIKYFKFITPALMEWAAMILADGNIRESSIRFYNKNHKMLSRFKELTFENLGKDVKWQMRERLGVPYFELLSGTAPKLLRYFFNAPADTKKSDTVEMPMNFMVKKNLISAFLRGYYQCDGYFSSKKGLIEISSASEKMIYQFKHLLLPFGIASRAFRKKKQHYLHITGWKNILRFKELVNPDIKVISYGSSGSTNVDIMEIDVGALTHVLSSLGIRRQDIGEEREIEHIFERGRGGRERVQWIYERICDLSREKIAKALECISVLNALECSVDSKTLEEDMNKVLRWMNNSHRRKLLENSTKIRSDALKIYHDGRRKPGIDNFLAILQSLRGLKVTGMEKTYSRLINLLLLRRTVMEAMEELGVSFNEIACTLETNSSNIAHYVQSDRLTVQSICTLPMIMKQVKMSIEERVLSEELIEHLSTLQFLSTCEIKWDRVAHIEAVQGGTVYDLSVEDTHNFIGGHGAMVLHNTTCAIALAKEIFGKHWHENFQETNASDERGIDVVRGRVKEFARSKPIGGDFKIIFLDESDSLTKDAQQALRRTMEKFSDVARFILSCNYSSRLIEPISSRCAVFRFKRLDKPDIESYVNRVVKGEGLKMESGSVEAIADITGGDLRKATNILQACATYDKITKDVVYEISAHAKPKDVAEMLGYAVKGDFHGARKLLYDMLINQGLATEDIVKSIHSELFKLELPDKTKIRLVEKLGEYEFRLNQGATPEIQLEAFLAGFLALDKG